MIRLARFGQYRFQLGVALSQMLHALFQRLHTVHKLLDQIDQLPLRQVLQFLSHTSKYEAPLRSCLAKNSNAVNGYHSG